MRNRAAVPGQDIPGHRNTEPRKRSASSNLGHQSSNFQTPKVRFLFQNEKALIAKEMALRRTSVAGELRASAPWGGVPCAENGGAGRHEFGRRERRSCSSCWRAEWHGGKFPTPRKIHNLHRAIW